MRRLFCISTFIIMLLSFMCTGCKHDEEPTFEALQEIDTTCIKRSVMNIVKQYVSQHKNDSAFVLITTYMREKVEFESNECYMINIASERSFRKGEFTRNGPYYPSKYFKIGDKYIFISSGTDSFVDQDKLKKDFYSIVHSSPEDLNKRFFIVYDRKDSCEFVDAPYGDKMFEGCGPYVINTIN